MVFQKERTPMKNPLFRILAYLIVLTFLFQPIQTLANSDQVEISDNASMGAAQTPMPGEPNPEQFEKEFEIEIEAERQRILEEHLREEGMPEELLSHEYGSDPQEKPEYIPPSAEVIAQTKAQVDSFSCDSVTDVPVIECEALVALYQSTNGAGWKYNGNWLVTNTVGTWGGIIISSGHVIYLSLPFNNLNGSIPSELGNLSNLQHLDLENNQLSGSIPPELGNLSNLVTLRLLSNQLSGSIPSALGNLSNLQYLLLENNQLSGSIPPELGNLSNLKDLYLWDNQLSGSIPPELGNLSNLYDLEMEENQLSGSISPELGNLRKLGSLSLFNNQLSGSIPPELGNLSSLWSLDLRTNQLSGSIPPELGNLSNLQDLWLASNQLSGSIPAELGNLSNLQRLWLGVNKLSGSIPAELGNLSNLYNLSLGTNQLSGSIPAELGNLSHLQYLWLHNNQLSGSIPAELGNLSYLQYLWLNDNQLSGNIPLNFINLISLEFFQFYNNLLCEPNIQEFLEWKATIVGWSGTGFICKPTYIKQKYLVVPLNWQGTQQQFIEAASIQISNFLDQVPLNSCRNDALIIKYLNVNTYNFNGFTCSDNDLNEIRNFVKNNAKLNPSDWDVIIGFTETSPCLPIAGRSNTINTIWVSESSDIIVAHELGHIFGLSDQYCSNQAGSIDKRCNDGDNQDDGWLTGDINFLDANLPYDCPPDGSEDNSGTKCCNY